MTYKPFINNRLHLAVQHEIIRLTKASDIHLEHRFKGHIADIYWESINTVFEVQCSPITLKEAKRRTADFEALGIHIVWILHQKTFNKTHMSPSEAFLVKNKHTYYCNISQAGDGIIFDQEEAIFYNTRICKSGPINIDMSSPLNTFFSKKHYFDGDLTSIPLIKRIQLFYPVWKKKSSLTFDELKTKGRYYLALIKWKISLG